jgi:hypothetical protein
MIHLFVISPITLRRRLGVWNAYISIKIVGDAMRIWLPDLGADRDVDRGQAGDDIDSPDMIFTRES